MIRTWYKLTGHVTEFPLTTRIFHSICIIVMLALAYNVPLNYFVGLGYIALLSGCSLVVIVLVYYLSRFKKQTPLALWLFMFTGNLLFTINFFLNSGINGPNDLFFIVTMVVMVTVIPVKQYWPLIAINLLLVTGLHALQYYIPSLVPYSYDSSAYRFLDITSAYWVVMVIVLLNFYFIRHNYETERRSAEQKTALMKVLNEEKNKLLSIISHDLRAPLSNVQNYLELLTIVEISQEESIDIKRKLLDSTRYTLDMVNNILSWSQSQMSGLKFRITPLLAHNVLMPQLLLFTNIAGNKQIKVEIYIDHDIVIAANEGMLQVIVRNLINNAIKFTSPGGRIIVSARTQDGLCTFMVRDSGNGKPAGLTANIFYLNSSTTAGTLNEKGVGLGLVLCKEFTEALQGRIWFECDPASGTTFFVELPLEAGTENVDENTAIFNI
ncbi:sensor histidine kinase [Mucilaginibacter terrae]|uniref:sensor histidine kinase n=1 Tax=Mucilaginibacter terrae TaxID=1955052 RepID=UPI00362E145D